jgi:hypothetical protein
MKWQIPLLIGLTSLVACAPSANLARDRYSTQAVIQSFQPSRGLQANYKIGEFVRFSFRLERAGFVTLIAADSAGIYELERNINMEAGARSLPLRTDTNAQGESAAYKIGPPAGPQRVIMLYTNAPGPNKTDVNFEGKLDNARLEEAVNSFFDRSGASARDLVEITVNVEKP